MKNTVLFYFFLCAAAFAQAQSTNKDHAGKSDLRGTWISSEFQSLSLVFDSDTSCNFFGDRFRYEIRGNELILHSKFETATHHYSIENNQLTISSEDWDTPMLFTKEITTESTRPDTKPETATEQSPSVGHTNVNQSLIGIWTGNGETIQFQADGSCYYQGILMQYAVSGNQITFTGAGGSTTLQYTLSDQNLSLTGNGNTVILQKNSAPGTSNPTTPGNMNKSTAGVIDPSIVGKWCYISSLTTQNASSSYSRCIVINANGTYEYHAEGSISGYGGGYYGGSSSQSADKGTWKLAGNQIFVQSEKEGYKVYSFEKRNHPKNNDPMIVIDGEMYVTYYQKSPW